MERNFKNLFHLPGGCTFLNCAYMSPLLKSVEQAGIEGIRFRRDLHTTTSKDFFMLIDELRATFAALIDAPAEAIAVVPAVSYGIGTVTRNLPLAKGESIVLAGEQFPSNYYPWQRLAQQSEATLKVIDPPAGPVNRGMEWNARLLDAIDEQTRCVAISVTHWTDGTLFDIAALRTRTDEVGAWLVIDGTQSVGALPFSVARFRPDALICAGYKWLLGPYSFGLAYYGDKLKDGIPVEENWINRLGSEDFKGLVNYTSEYQPGNMRYSVGEQSNFVLAPMMLEALKAVHSIGPDTVQAHTGTITREALRRLQSEGFQIGESGQRANHLFGIRLPAHSDVTQCAKALSDQNIVVSWRGSALRVSPHVYNSADEIDLLADALLDAVKIPAS